MVKLIERQEAAQAVAPERAADNPIYTRLMSAILDRKLPPGTKLVEDRLSEAFGVSRTRIRPVLVRLANERVVTITPNRGASIAQPTAQEAREVFEARRLIEPTLVARFVAVATVAHLRNLARCIRNEEAARRAGDTPRAVRLSGDFHLHIADQAGHQTLGRVLRELISRTSLILMAYGDLRNPAHDQTSACGCDEHRALLSAIKLRDAEASARLMQDHLQRLESQLNFRRERPPAPDLVDLFSRLS